MSRCLYQQRSTRAFLGFTQRVDLKQHLEFADIRMHTDKRTVAIPVFNTSDSAIKLRKGECLGSLTELDAEKVIDMTSIDLKEHTASASTTQLSNTLVDAENSYEAKLQEIVNNYKEK